MNCGIHQRTLEELCRILEKIERCSEAPEQHTKALHIGTKSRAVADMVSSKHDITVAVTSLWNFVNDSQKAINAIKARGEDDAPIFALMNDRLFNLRRFREVITRIMSDYYCFMLKPVIQRDPRILLLGNLVEALSTYIRLAKKEGQFLEDEAFNNTISLMKVNRILQLKDLKVSVQDMYHDFSTGQVPDESETNITNSLAAGDRIHETQKSVAEQLRQVRKIRADMSKMRIVLENFERCFANVLFTKLDFALFWKEALASAEFGYAVECYSEKCETEFDDFRNKRNDISRLIGKLLQAESLLSKLEERASTHLLMFVNDAQGLSNAVRESLPVLVALCLHTVGARFKNLIGEVNIRKYKQLRLQIPVIPSLVSRHDLKYILQQKPDEKHGFLRVSKVAELLKLGASGGLHRSPTKRAKRLVSDHRDIVDEYEAAFSQTQAMLERRKQKL